MSAATESAAPVRRPGIHWKAFGATAPTFPGFEVDISTRVPPDQKPDAVWHRERARAMLRAHPELRDLIRRNPATALLGVLFVGLHWGIALCLGGQPWWLVLLVAYVLGGWIATNLFYLGHEFMHGLVFRSMFWNRCWYTCVTAPLSLTLHHTWWIDHAVHHNDMGSPKDFLTRRRTFLLATRKFSPLFLPWSMFLPPMQALRSAVGLLMYLGGLLTGRVRPGPRTLAVLSDEHLVSGFRGPRLPLWAVVYPAFCLAQFGVVFALGGWQPVVYLLLSSGFLMGFLNPWQFGLILGNAHFNGYGSYQPTASYYGWLNWLTLNHGLHTEHHDLAGVPWNRLPQVRRIAPEFYENLAPIQSYVKLSWEFHFGGEAAPAANHADETLRVAQPPAGQSSGAE